MLKNHSQLKILILMAYYNRPILVRNALNSILKSNKYHQNWHLLFGDDGSKIAGRPIAEEILKDHLSQITFIDSNHTFEDKIKDGLTLGKYANATMRESDADIALMLCDDDELVPDYLSNLNKFFIENPNFLYCYSKIYIYNPLIQKSEESKSVIGKFNKWTGPIEPVNKLDASQVAWRIDCCKLHNAWFGETTKVVEGKPWTSDTDRSLFEQLQKKCGLCYPTNVVGQYKGVHDYQLLWHKDVAAASLYAYDKMCRELSGVAF
jgi:hypothetical protein